MLEIVLALVSGGVALLVVFVTPVGQALANRLTTKKLVFSLDKYHLEDNLRVIVKPENKGAQKKRPLGLAIGGRFYSKIATPTTRSGALCWEVDLFQSGVNFPSLVAGRDVELRFYFDAEHLSDAIPITATPAALFMSAIELGRSADPQGALTLTASDTVTLIRGMINSSSLELTGPEIKLDFPLSVESQRIAITDVYDGKEISFGQLSGVTIFSRQNTSILAIPRYAWVLDFVQCKDLTFRGLTVGHSDAGYCQGGVLRFRHCSQITLEQCDLYGSGTVGISLSSCESVRVRNSRIHGCTYHIGEFSDCKLVIFEDCDFFDNQEFSLLNFSGTIKDFMFVKCRFYGNRSNENMVSVGPSVYLQEASLVFTDCRFFENSYVKLSNADAVKFVNCTVEDQLVPPRFSGR